MESSERTLLLSKDVKTVSNEGLSVALAAVCIIDVFGVFPFVALPKAIIQCGYFGVLIVVIVCTIQIYTSILLTKSWLIAEEIDQSIDQKSRYPYSALAEKTYGKRISKLVTFLLDSTVFAGGIPNLLVASQNLQLLGKRLSNDQFDFSYCYWIILLGAIICPFLWLGSPKDMKLLCTVSVCLVISVFVLVLGCIIFDSRTIEERPAPDVSLWNLLLTAYGILVFQFDIHPTILTIQVDMIEKRRITKSILVGFMASLAMFAAVAISAAVKYGLSTHWSLLDTLPSSTFLHLAAFLIATQLSLTSAIGNSALYQHLEDTLDIRREFNCRRCIVRTVLTVMAILLAESVPRFDIVMSMIGGALTGPIVFILPPLIYIKMVCLKRKHEEQLKREAVINMEAEVVPSMLGPEEEQELGLQIIKEEVPRLKITRRNTQVVLCIAIVIFGMVTVLSVTYVNVINTVHYANFSRPCIYNLQMYL